MHKATGTFGKFDVLKCENMKINNVKRNVKA